MDAIIHLEIVIKTLVYALAKKDLLELTAIHVFLIHMVKIAKYVLLTVTEHVTMPLVIVLMDVPMDFGQQNVTMNVHMDVILIVIKQPDNAVNAKLDLLDLIVINVM
jgi:hypothetical protein